MKNTLALIILLLASFYSLKAGDYQKLIEGNKYWDIATQNGASICRYSAFPRRYFFKGDTTIDDKNYRRICFYSFESVDGTNSICPPYIVDTTAISTQILIREDTIQQKVFEYNNSEKKEYLLYDFNLSVGDTLKYALSNTHESGTVVLDSVVVIKTDDGISRRKYYVSRDGNEFSSVGYYIDGIGSDNGPFALPTTIIGEAWNSLMSVSTEEDNIIGFSYPFVSEAFKNNFATSNAIWNTHILSSEGSYRGNQICGINGDTLISDTLYHKVYLLSDTLFADNYNEVYLGGLRKDEKKVWFKPAYWTASNILLYDFGVSVGDTIWHNAYARIVSDGSVTFSKGDNYSIVKYIETLNGTNLSIEYQFNPGQQWNSSFGSTHGLFGSIMDMPLPGDNYKLACFKQNDTVKYISNAKCDNCFCRSSGVDSYLSRSPIVFLYPNPVKDQIELTVQIPYHRILVELFDIEGRRLLLKEMQTDITIPSSLKGFYLLKVTIDNQVQIDKIVIE